MLAQLFHSATRAVILTRLFSIDTPKYHLRQLARDGGLSAPGLLKELTHLHQLRLVKMEETHGKTIYSADTSSPLFATLCELVEKTEGLSGKIYRMLRPLDTECIFIYGSEANGTARLDSDIDLFIIGSCSLLQISQALLPAADLTDREINPVVFTPAVFRERCQKNDHFLMNVLGTPKIFLKGGEHELKGLAGSALRKAHAQECL